MPERGPGIGPWTDGYLLDALPDRLPDRTPQLADTHTKDTFAQQGLMLAKIGETSLGERRSRIFGEPSAPAQRQSSHGFDEQQKRWRPHWTEWPRGPRRPLPSAPSPEILNLVFGEGQQEVIGDFWALKDREVQDEETIEEIREREEWVLKRCIQLLPEADDDDLRELLAAFELTPDRLIQEQFKVLEAELSYTSVDLEPRIVPTPETVVADRRPLLRDFLELCTRDILKQTPEDHLALASDSLHAVSKDCQRLLKSYQAMIGRWLRGFTSVKDVNRWEPFKDQVLSNLRATILRLKEVGCSPIEAATILRVISAIPTDTVFLEGGLPAAVAEPPTISHHAVVPPEPDRLIPLSGQSDSASELSDDGLIALALRKIFVAPEHSQPRATAPEAEPTLEHQSLARLRGELADLFHQRTYNLTRCPLDPDTFNQVEEVKAEAMAIVISLLHERQTHAELAALLPKFDLTPTDVLDAVLGTLPPHNEHLIREFVEGYTQASHDPFQLAAIIRMLTVRPDELEELRGNHE